MAILKFFVTESRISATQFNSLHIFFSFPPYQKLCLQTITQSYLLKKEEKKKKAGEGKSPSVVFFPLGTMPEKLPL